MKQVQHDSHFIHFQFVVGGELQVRVVGRRPELVASDDEEHKAGNLLEQFIYPLILEWYRDLPKDNLIRNLIAWCLLIISEHHTIIFYEGGLK